MNRSLREMNRPPSKAGLYPATLGWSPGFWTALVGLFAVAVFLPSIGFDLVYDSAVQIQIDDFIHQSRHFADVLTLRVLGMDVLDFNRPVNLLTLLVDSRLWGLNPAGYHFTNVLLHGLTAALLFRWLLGLVGRFWPALVAALWFAVHPLNCETVVEVGYREDLLATFFLLAALDAARFFRPNSEPGIKPGALGGIWLPAFLTVGCCFLSAASKESGIAGPAVLAAYWLAFRRDEKRGPWLMLIAASSAAVGGFLAVRFALAPKQSGIFAEAAPWLAGTWGELLSVQVRIWAAEFERIVWPTGICADYNGYSIREIGIAGGVLGTGLVCGLQAAAAWRNRLAGLGIAVFWFALLPVSNFIPIYRPMADRFLYMPLTGVALILAALMSNIRAKAAWTPVVATCGLLALLGLWASTWVQEQYWKDDSTLWTETARANPFSCNAWLGLGYAWLDRNEPMRALESFNRASALAKEQSGLAAAGTALAAEALGRHAQAADSLAHAIKLDARYADVDTVVRSLLVTASQARRLGVIAARFKISSNKL